MITGFGVSESVKHYFDIWGKEIESKKVIVQGWGNVGASAAYYLAQAGFIIVGIIDKNGGLINEKGFSFNDIKKLFLNKKSNELTSPNLLSYEEINNIIWDISADVFIPCAASRLINLEHIERLIQSGLTLIASGANVPFADQEIFYGPIAEYADKRLSVIPDFISNCGMARVFAYLMEERRDDLNDYAIFNDCSIIIRNALVECFNTSSNPNLIMSNALEIALKKLTLKKK
tara:strand:- start:2986 stop:3681 length:696 start_codon:yes stop_codon:yes gene_type:complete